MSNWSDYNWYAITNNKSKEKLLSIDDVRKILDHSQHSFFVEDENENTGYSFTTQFGKIAAKKIKTKNHEKKV